MNHFDNKSKLSLFVSGTWLFVGYTVWLLDLITDFYYDPKLGPLQTILMLGLIVCLPDAGPGRGWQTEGRTVHNTPPAPAKYCPLYPIHDQKKSTVVEQYFKH